VVRFLGQAKGATERYGALPMQGLQQ